MTRHDSIEQAAQDQIHYLLRPIAASQPLSHRQLPFRQRPCIRSSLLLSAAACRCSRFCSSLLGRSLSARGLLRAAFSAAAFSAAAFSAAAFSAAAFSARPFRQPPFPRCLLGRAFSARLRLLAAASRLSSRPLPCRRFRLRLRLGRSFRRRGRVQFRQLLFDFRHVRCGRIGILLRRVELLLNFGQLGFRLFGLFLRRLQFLRQPHLHHDRMVVPEIHLEPRQILLHSHRHVVRGLRLPQIQPAQILQTLELLEPASVIPVPYKFKY